MTFLAFADAHPWPAVALVALAVLFAICALDRFAPTRKPPTGGAP